MRKILASVAFAFVALFNAGGASAQATATQDITITANVVSYCTINNISTPAALTAAIPVPLGVVDIAPIVRTIASVACNNTANVTATSLSGGVGPGGAAPSGTENIIDYIGQAAFAGATSTINTITAPARAGNEAGNTATTASAATGNLVVTITPATPSLPLAPSAAYTDTLRVTLTAN